jgi:hypothetical protein
MCGLGPDLWSVFLFKMKNRKRNWVEKKNHQQKKAACTNLEWDEYPNRRQMGIDRIVVFKIALNKDANVDIFLYFCLPAETTNDKRKQQQKNPITIGMGPII